MELNFCIISGIVKEHWKDCNSGILVTPDNSLEILIGLMKGVHVYPEINKGDNILVIADYNNFHSTELIARKLYKVTGHYKFTEE